MLPVQARNPCIKSCPPQKLVCAWNVAHIWRQAHEAVAFYKLFDQPQVAHTHTQITKAINQSEKFSKTKTKSLCSLGMLFFQVLYIQNMKHGCPFGFLGLEFAPLRCVLP